MDKYYHSRVSKAQTILREISDFTDIEDEARVLSVGCEFGHIEHNLAKWTSWDITAVELTDKIKEYGYKNIKTVVADATALPFGTEFDLVIANQMIEHVPEYKKLILELHRVLKRGGYLYLATPNLKRKLVNHKVLFADKKNLNVKSRMEHHMGFSLAELSEMLSIFSKVTNINKEHLAGRHKVFAAVPGRLMDYAQTNVFICRK